MPASLNKCAFIGNVGREPEMRFSADGNPYTNFSIAVNEKKDSPPTWIEVVAWRKLAELCNQYLVKGRQVYVEGRYQSSSYEKDGQKHYKVQIVANNCQFFGQSTSGKPEINEEEVPF